MINVTGSILIGVFMGLFLRERWDQSWRLLIAVGVLGGYTTFSSFSFETMRLVIAKDYGSAAGYVVGSVVLSLAGTALGFSATAGHVR